jgi:uncharacterized membrane protein YhaH (DUF805 family)/ribosomal protein L32
MDWYLEVLRKYAVFDGRARRREYWMFWLVNTIIEILLAIIDILIFIPGLLGAIYSLLVFIPSLAVTVRRLHDTNRSGWSMLINLIPLFGWFFLLTFLIQDSTLGENQYGPNPKVEYSEFSNKIPPEMKKCPHCAEIVKREVRICPHCGYEFYPKPKTIEEEINEFEKKKNNKSINDFEDEEII